MVDASKKTKPKNKTVKVNYKLGDQKDPNDKTAKVNYTLGTTPNYDPDNITRTVTYNIKTKGDKPKFNGTANFNGTAHAYGTAKASGDWSVKKSETALVGELGRKILRQCIVICM